MTTKTPELSQPEPEKKEFSLKPIEAQMLQTMQQQMTILITNMLSFIAIERLNYPVTERTTFDVAQDFKSIRVWEPEQPAADAQPAVEAATATDTAKAIKGA